MPAETPRLAATAAAPIGKRAGPAVVGRLCCSAQAVDANINTITTLAVNRSSILLMKHHLSLVVF
jgi:hypothetical protein